MPAKTARYHLRDLMTDHNPHVWLSVKKAKMIASAARDRLAVLDPEGKAAYDANLASYEKKLDELDGRIGNMYREIKGRQFIQWHPSWNYFASDYGIVVAGTIESGHGDSPSLGHFKDLIERARRGGVKAVVVDLNVQSGAAESLAREIGGRMVRLDGIGDPGNAGKATYIELMESNAKVFAAALAGR